MTSTNQTTMIAAAATAAILTLGAFHRLFIHSRQTLHGSTRPGNENKKRCILITGAGSGIGLETARLFHRRGWKVGLMDVNLEAVKNAAVELANSWFAVCDVSDADTCTRLVKEFADNNDGKIDVLFNCAGLLQTGLFKDIPLRKQTAQIRVNMEGVVNMTYAALPFLVREGDGGRVITMASGSAQSGIPYHAVYASTKAAIYSLTEALNIEFQRENISCADVSVMYVATNMVHSQTNTSTPLLQMSKLFITPNLVANRVWDAVHQCRLHREHFYVESSLNAAFKFNAFCRAFGMRWAMRIVALTNMPPLA